MKHQLNCDFDLRHTPPMIAHIFAMVWLLMFSWSASAQLPKPCCGWNPVNSLEAIWGCSYSSQPLFTAAAIWPVRH